MSKKTYKWFCIFFFCFLCSTVVFLFLYITKPQNIIKTEQKVIEKEVSACRKSTTLNGMNMCEASRACENQGGRLKLYKDTFGNGPEFECEYESTR